MATKLEFEILNTHSMYVLLRQSPHGQSSKRCTTVLYNNLAIRTKQQTRYIHLISSTNVIFKKLQATIMAFQCARNGALKFLLQSFIIRLETEMRYLDDLKIDVEKNSWMTGM